MTLNNLSITIIIIGITALVSFVAFSNHDLFRKLVFTPFAIKARKEWYRFLTHAFIHGSTGHLLLNMFVLYMFGSITEQLYEYMIPGAGMYYFIALYVGGVVFASLPAYKKHMNNPNYNAVGASGATSAVLFAYILMFPFQKVYIMFIPIGIWGIVFGFLYLAYEYYMDKKSSDNIAHDAHFYGALYGVLFTAALNPQLVVDFGYLDKLLNG